MENRDSRDTKTTRDSKDTGDTKNIRDTKEKILEATIRVFGKKGLKFTMDDIACELAMSKKTIYMVFRDKESMLLQMVDYCFDKIKESEEKILKNYSMSTTEKLRAILCVLPDGYSELDFRQLYVLKEKYPDIYRKMEQRLETGWEGTIALINRGMQEGVIRKINVIVFKTMFEATLEQFLQRDILITNQISYKEALDECVNILVDGIVKEQGD